MKRIGIARLEVAFQPQWPRDRDRRHVSGPYSRDAKESHLCVCVCVCVCVCIICMYVCMHVCMYVCMYIRMYVHIYTYVYIYMDICSQETRENRT